MTLYADPRREQHIAMVVIIRVEADMRWTLSRGHGGGQAGKRSGRQTNLFLT